MSTIQLSYIVGGRVFQSRTTEGIDFASNRSGNQALFEIRIPWIAIGSSSQPRQFSMEVQVNDADGGSRERQAVADNAYQDRGAFQLIRTKELAIQPSDALEDNCQVL